MNQDIRAYLQQLLKDAGQTDLPPELEEQMIQDLNTRLEDRLIMTAMENLTEQKQDELGAMAENSEPSGKMEEFVRQNVPNWEGVFAQALVDFRETYLGR